MAVVLDANVFVSAALTADGPSAKLLQAVQAGKLVAIVSPHLLREVREVLQRSRFRQYLSLEEVDEYVDELGRICRVEPDPPPGEPVLADPDDDYLIYLARQVGAECIVSGDGDLRETTIDPHSVTPRQAVEMYLSG